MKKSVIAIGNFDGVHLGHQDVLRHARMLSDKHGFDFCVLTFSPHPRQVFQPELKSFRITPDPVKREVFDTIINPDLYQVLDFNEEFQHQSADAFIENILAKQLNAGIVMVGHDFHFGYQRSGNVETLKFHPEFKTVTVDLIEIGGAPVSSTRIRDHIKNAEINQANALLGWDWYVESEVIHGDKRGRELGYPTANMRFGDSLVPSYGIYAVKAQIDGSNEWLHGAANIGVRPMFESQEPLLETYIFDFDDDLYGQTLRIMPVQKIRDEMKFDDLEALKAQMADDCAKARAILSEEN